MRRLRHLCAVVVGIVVLASCRVDTTVVVSIAENGGGVVTVEVVADTAAMRRVGPDLDGLMLGDLDATGWQVEGPLLRGDDVIHRAAKPFAGSDELGAVLGEVLGPDVLSGFRLDRTKEWAQVDYRLTGTVDLTGGLESLGDTELTAALDGQPLGVDLEALAEEIGGDPAERGSVSLVVVMPGETADGSVSEELVVDTTFAADAPIGVDIRTVDRAEGPRQWRMMAVGLGASAVLLAVLGVVAPVLLRPSVPPPR